MGWGWSASRESSEGETRGLVGDCDRDEAPLPSRSSEGSIDRSGAVAAGSRDDGEEMLGLSETARLSFEFCILWV